MFFSDLARKFLRHVTASHLQCFWTLAMPNLFWDRRKCNCSKDYTLDTSILLKHHVLPKMLAYTDVNRTFKHFGPFSTQDENPKKCNFVKDCNFWLVNLTVFNRLKKNSTDVQRTHEQRICFSLVCLFVCLFGTRQKDDNQTKHMVRFLPCPQCF